MSSELARQDNIEPSSAALEKVEKPDFDAVRSGIDGMVFPVGKDGELKVPASLIVQAKEYGMLPSVFRGVYETRVNAFGLANRTVGVPYLAIGGFVETMVLTDFLGVAGGVLGVGIVAGLASGMFRSVPAIRRNAVIRHAFKVKLQESIAAWMAEYYQQLDVKNVKWKVADFMFLVFGRVWPNDRADYFPFEAMKSSDFIKEAKDKLPTQYELVGNVDPSSGDLTFEIIETATHRRLKPTKKPPVVKAGNRFMLQSSSDEVKIFSWKSRLVADRLPGLLAKLSKQSLSVEDEHVVKRAMTDFDELTKMLNNSAEIASEKYVEPAAVYPTLKRLEREVNTVRKSQSERLKQKLAAHNEYVKSREYDEL